GAFVPTETGDDDLDGNTFLEIDSAIDISEITQDRGIGQPVTITFSAGNMDQEAVVDELVKDRRNFLGRKAKLWLFFLNADEDSVLPEFTVLFSGVMVAAETQRQVGRPAVISVTCDQDLQHAETAPVRWIDHMLFYPDDTWSSFITDLSRGPIGTASAEVRTINGIPASTPIGQTPAYGMAPNSGGTIGDYYDHMMGNYNAFTGER